MSKRGTRKRTINKFGNVSKWGTTFSGSFPSERRTRTSGWSTIARTRQVVSKEKPISGNARIDKTGWRNPTQFRAYVIQQIAGPAFDYTVTKANGVDFTQHRGAQGFLPDSVVTFTTGVSGAGYFPRTSLNLANRATTECLNKLKDGVGSLAETIAEINQTIGLMTETIFEMYDIAALVMRRGRPGRIKNRFLRSKRKHQNLDWEFFRKKASERWLEVHYGWYPLVGDLIAYMNAIQNGLPKLRTSAVRNLSENHGLPSNTGNSDPYFFSVTGEVKSGCKVRADAKIVSPGIALLDSLELINPFQLGWALLPYSFVIDWLIPISNVMKALTVSAGLELLGVSTTKWTKCDLKVRWTLFDGASLKGEPITAQLKSLSTYRTASKSWPWPALYMKSPFNTTRLVTAIALLMQLK